jgi:hypothetical protein
MNKKEKLANLVKSNQPILLVGEPGFGYEEFMREVAEAVGMKFISVYACDPNAWHCLLPKFNTDRYPQWAIEAVNNPETEYLLFFDEVQECLENEHIKLSQFVEQRTIGDMILNNVRISAAYNQYEGNACKELSDLDYFQNIISW